MIRFSLEIVTVKMFCLKKLQPTRLVLHENIVISITSSIGFLLMREFSKIELLNRNYRSFATSRDIFFSRNNKKLHFVSDSYKFFHSIAFATPSTWIQCAMNYKFSIQMALIDLIGW